MLVILSTITSEHFYIKVYKSIKDVLVHIYEITRFTSANNRVAQSRPKGLTNLVLNFSP